MLDINKMIVNKKQEINKSTYVGLPGVGMTFTVHPNDQTNANSRACIYYNSANRRNYIIDSSTYSNYEELYENILENLTSSVLYRAMYSNGIEFIIPIHDYAGKTVLNKTIEEAKKGNWFKRNTGNIYQIDGSDHMETWSTLTFNQLINQAFEGFVIDNEDHPLVGSFNFLK